MEPFTRGVDGCRLSRLRPMHSGVTVARRVEGGWECVDDHGRRLVLPVGVIDPALRGLRVGQRLLVEVVDGLVVRGSLP